MTLGRGNDARCRGFESLRAHLKTHCNVLLQCAFGFDVILVSESLQQPILCHIGVLPFAGFSFLGLFIVVRIGTVVREVGFLFTKASYSIAASDRLCKTCPISALM